jgi:hypothetical protein
MDSQKLINLDLEFRFDECIEGTLICSHLPDRVITIVMTDPKTFTTTLDKFGNSISGKGYTCTTVFKDSKSSFSYQINRNGDVRPDEVIGDSVSKCLLNYLPEDYCDKILLSFDRNQRLVFSRTTESGYPRFTIEGIHNNKSLGHGLQKNFIYDYVLNTFYQDVDRPSGSFYGCFEGIDFSSSFFYMYEAMNNDSFKFKIFHKYEKKYINLTYSDYVLTVNNLIDNTTDLVVGDNDVTCKIEDLMSRIIIETPNDLLAKYANDFGLDLDTLTKNDIKTICMAYY